MEVLVKPEVMDVTVDESIEWTAVVTTPELSCKDAMVRQSGRKTRLGLCSLVRFWLNKKSTESDEAVEQSWEVVSISSYLHYTLSGRCLPTPLASSGRDFLAMSI